MFRLLVMSDLHCGDATGLTPPKWHNDEFGDFQRPFWEWYVGTVKSIGPVDALVLDGDLIHGPARRDSAGHLTTNVKKQTKMAAECIKQVETKRRYIVRGTGYHTDHGGPLEDYIADSFGIDAEDELRLEIYGRKLLFRHVVGRSDIPYGQYTQIAKEMINEILQGSFEGYPAADINVRAHAHYSVMVSVGDAVHGRERIALVNPALSLRGPEVTSFVRGLRTWLYHVGMTLIEIEDNGEVFIRRRFFKSSEYLKRGYECLTKDAR